MLFQELFNCGSHVFIVTQKTISQAKLSAECPGACEVLCGWRHFPFSSFQFLAAFCRDLAVTYSWFKQKDVTQLEFHLQLL